MDKPDRRIIESPNGFYITPWGAKIPNGTSCEIIRWQSGVPLVRFDDDVILPVPADWLKKVN